MIQFLFKFILCVLLAMAAAFAYFAVKSGAPLYTFYEWLSPARFHRYDRLIRGVALEHHLDPMLVKAVVWRESRFDPKKRGTHGERGLMQVSERAANEWARETKIAGFDPDQLFEPKTNLEAGTWYLHRAMQHWEHQSDPFRLPWRSTTPGPVAPSVGVAAAVLRRYRSASFLKRSTSPPREGMSSQSSTAIDSISVVERCEDRGRMRDPIRTNLFPACAVRIGI
jgi:soluble lytic murein transglycosylase-like protein